MQRILSLYDWHKLPVDNSATITSDLEDQRAVRVRVNAPAPMALYILQDDYEEEIFLAYVVGLDELQFQIQGSYSLIARGGDVWFDTLDGTNPSVEPVEPASFTQIVERRVRNPEMELMERKMQENIERRMAILMANVTDTMAAKDAEIEAARNAIASIDTAEPKPVGGQIAPDDAAGTAATGNGDNEA